MTVCVPELLSAEEVQLLSRVARADGEMLAKVNPIKQISHLGRVGAPNPNPRPKIDDVGKVRSRRLLRSF